MAIAFLQENYLGGVPSSKQFTSLPQTKSPSTLLSCSILAVRNLVEEIMETEQVGKGYFTYRTADEVVVAFGAAYVRLDQDSDRVLPKDGIITDSIECVPTTLQPELHGIFYVYQTASRVEKIVLETLQEYHGNFLKIPESTLVIWLHLKDRLTSIDLASCDFINPKKVETLRKFFPKLDTIQLSTDLKDKFPNQEGLVFA